MRQDDWLIIDTLYSNKSITVTAEKLYLTQPALTRRLQRIEDEFDTTIVKRSSQGITFTTEGKLIAMHAKKMLQEYDTILKELKRMQNNIFGTIRIGISNSLARYMLPDLLQSFKQTYPEVDFEVITGFSSEAVRLVYNREVQIGFVRANHIAHLNQHLISTDEAYIVSKEPIAMKDLSRIPRIDFYSDIPSQTIIENWWYEHFSDAPYVAMKLKSGSTCFEMIKRGLGYGIFLTDSFFKNDQTVYKEKIYYKTGEPVTRGNWMIYRDELKDDLQIKTFLEFCLDYFQHKPQ